MEIVLEDGSGVAIDWVTGQSYSSARRRLNVQSGQRKGGKCAAALARALPSVIVDTEKVLREADGSVKLVVVRPHTDGKVFAPGCASKPDGESREEPEEHKREMSRWPCKDYLRGTCNNSFCEKWHPPECLFYKTKSGGRFGEKCSFTHRQVDAQPTERSKKNDDKSEVAILKKGDREERGPVTDQCHDRSGKPDKRRVKKLGQKSSNCVFQDMTPPKSILRKCTGHAEANPT